MRPLADSEDLLTAAQRSASPEPEPRAAFEQDQHAISLGIPPGQLDREVNRRIRQRDMAETDSRRNHDRISDQRNRHAMYDPNDPAAQDAQAIRDRLNRFANYNGNLPMGDPQFYKQPCCPYSTQGSTNSPTNSRHPRSPVRTVCHPSRRTTIRPRQSGFLLPAPRSRAQALLRLRTAGQDFVQGLRLGGQTC